MKTKFQKKNNKAGMAIIAYHGTSIVINSSNVDDLKEWLLYLKFALYDSIRVNQGVAVEKLVNEDIYIKHNIELSLNHIIEL